MLPYLYFTFIQVIRLSIIYIKFGSQLIGQWKHYDDDNNSWRNKTFLPQFVKAATSGDLWGQNPRGGTTSAGTYRFWASVNLGSPNCYICSWWVPFL